MKRALVGIFCISALAVAFSQAADTVALAAQQEMQDNYKRLTATFEELQAAQMALQKQVSALAVEVGKLRDEVAHNNNNAATQESMRELNKQILKVDESRIADNKRIQEAIEKMGGAIKNLSSAPMPPPKRGETGNGGGSPAGGTKQPPAIKEISDQGYEYVILKDDILGKIVARYREEGIMVTSAMIMAANPTVDWNKLKVGSKIFIPKPK